MTDPILIRPTIAFLKKRASAVPMEGHQEQHGVGVRWA